MDGWMDGGTEGRRDKGTKGQRDRGREGGESTFKAASMVVLPGDVELPEEVIEGRPDTEQVGQDVVARVEEQAVEQGDGDAAEDSGGAGGAGGGGEQGGVLGVEVMLQLLPVSPCFLCPPGRKELQYLI